MRETNYINDCLKELIERAARASSEAKRSGGDFESGRSMAYYEVVSYLLGQADAFGLTPTLDKKIRQTKPDSLL